MNRIQSHLPVTNRIPSVVAPAGVCCGSFVMLPMQSAPQPAAANIYAIAAAEARRQVAARRRYQTLMSSAYLWN